MLSVPPFNSGVIPCNFVGFGVTTIRFDFLRPLTGTRKMYNLLYNTLSSPALVSEALILLALLAVLLPDTTYLSSPL